MRFKLLHDYFGSAELIWKADYKCLIATGLTGGLVDRFVTFRNNFDFGEHQTELSKKEIKFYCLVDEEYPEILKQIPDPPLAIFIKGDLGNLEKAIAVVGTRRMTGYGGRACASLCKDLVLAGATIVSGMARGIDTVAHRTALENGGRTVAVLGTGVDIIYPPENREIYYKILKNGAVVSEISPGSDVEKGAFRFRNRIISGLSKGVVVVEGAKESGSLITARYALDQGRDVFAVPGPINSVMSEGPAYLISQGAKLIMSGQEVIEEIK